MIESTFEAEVERTRKAVRGMAFVEGILHGATSVPAWVVEGRVVRQRRHMDGVRYEPVASVEPLAGASAMQRLCAYLPSFAREAVQEANLITSVEGRLGGAALRQGAELVGSIEVIDAQAMTPPPCKERRQLLEASDTLRKLVASGIDGLDRRLAEVTHLLRQNEQLWLEERGKMMCLARAIEAQVSCHTDAAARFPDA
jgi:hypothetical protein